MITFSQGGEAKIYDAPCLTKITLDNWRYFGQVEVFSTAGGTLDNWRCSRQLEVLWTTGCTLDNWRYFGQLEVLWTTGGTLDNWRYFGQIISKQFSEFGSRTIHFAKKITTDKYQ